MKFALLILAAVAVASAQLTSPLNSFSSLYGNTDFTYPSGFGYAGSYSYGYPGFDYNTFLNPSFASFPGFSGFNTGFGVPPFTSGFTDTTFSGLNTFPSSPLLGSDIKGIYPAPVVSIANDAVSVSAPDVISSVPTPTGKSEILTPVIKTTTTAVKSDSSSSSSASSAESKTVVTSSGPASIPVSISTPISKSVVAGSAVTAIDSAAPTVSDTVAPTLTLSGTPALSTTIPFARSFYSGDIAVPSYSGPYGTYANNFGFGSDLFNGFNSFGSSLNALKKKRSA